VHAIFLTFRDLMIEMLGGGCEFPHRQHLLVDECIVKKNNHIFLSILIIPTENLFDGTGLLGLGFYESTEKLSEYFFQRLGMKVCLMGTQKLFKWLVREFSQLQ
jgi:hypothetical protein